MGASEIVLLLAERWNAGDMDGVLDLYTDDVVMVPGEDWPDTLQLEGKHAFRKNMEEWLGVWESVEIEAAHVESFGDRVVATGCWRSTGRVSGVEGTMAVHMLFTVSDGRIARLEWYPDHERAVAAARDS
jgi:ketosteroid isomerase-like protein